MKYQPETYEELIRKKRCIDLTKYYELSATELDKIYDFLTRNPRGIVKCGTQSISLITDDNISDNTVIVTNRIDYSIDGILMSNQKFNVIPHYTPSSGSSYGGGSSSNNNNNNSNNNNNN